MRTYNPRNIPLARHLRNFGITIFATVLCDFSAKRPLAATLPISTVPAPALSLNWTVPSIIRRNNSRQMPAALRILPPTILPYYASPIWI